ncbi:subtilisin-like [Folsomia candida]|uniref:subtilisin-like n=1 Tax=Folsomia candida TaxID=158441 RepID=UPI000B90986D|nr:subtilisin-like [Folsomia candida]
MGSRPNPRPVAWANNITGEGIVVGIIDTGVNGGHVALNQSFAGVWMDPYFNRSGPSDPHDHGTLVAGIIMGRANGVGVEPGAKYVACAGLNSQGSGIEYMLIRCAQYLITETPRPYVINNAWGGPLADATCLPGRISAELCNSTYSPGNQADVISVGATSEIDAVLLNSDRGPSPDGLLKPELSAPGSNIVSCWYGYDNYRTTTDVTLASAHVTRAVALILSAHPTWTFDDILDALITSAVHPTLSNEDRICGLPGPGDYPNYSFDHGRIDVAAALGL